jgi:hypothetical protein
MNHYIDFVNAQHISIEDGQVIEGEVVKCPITLNIKAFSYLESKYNFKLSDLNTMTQDRPMTMITQLLEGALVTHNKGKNLEQLAEDILNTEEFNELNAKITKCVEGFINTKEEKPKKKIAK